MHIFNQKSNIIEFPPSAKNELAQKKEDKTRELRNSGNKTEKSTNGQKLSKEEQKEVKELGRIDRQVRSRELTHRAVAGSYARGSVYFDYVTGPDGKKYAEEGHINIDARPIPNNPEATIREARMELKTEQRKVSDDVTKASGEKNHRYNSPIRLNPELQEPIQFR